MEQNILVFGAGRSSTYLIDYLKKKLSANSWRLTVADNNLHLAQQKTADCSRADALSFNVHDENVRVAQIRKSDIIISLLPPSLHILVAKDCLAYRKNLLTASYVDEHLLQLGPLVKEHGLLFLCEMGLDPGIDHMSAMKAINHIKSIGGKITSFHSHCGGLVAPESDDNPWHYKISWNSANVVKAGIHGASFKQDGQVHHLNYQHLFKNVREVDIPSSGKFSFYPNRDSLNYIPVYHLEDAASFMRTTLRHPEFIKGWYIIVQAGLTDDKTKIEIPGLTFREWSKTIRPYITAENAKQFEFLGLFDDSTIPQGLNTSSDIMQYLLDSKLPLRDNDRDMVVMLHQIKYMHENREFNLNSSLAIKGENNLYTAMAKTVGLPLGIAATLILEKKIPLTGVQIPVLKEVYEPVLKELHVEGISFVDTLH